ncbi:TetR/AcrR family transcriptional regulator [Streptomyces sp. NPDC002817]|uniref:TetR/AcrR family transcriptional regulator n=1 Tax=Streptomyces sp. NPDC088357 TaxID=3154655 RepID=UPI0034442AE3
MNEVAPSGARPQRADARENVRQILRAARAVFADRGYEVSIEEVARRSGLGMGTIYRHFPNKRALVEEVAIGHMRETSEVLARALTEEPDAWSAFTRVMRHMAEVRSSQMFPVSRRRTTESGPALVAARDALLADLDGLVARAQGEGALRGDVNTYDLVLMMVSLPPRIPESEGVAADLTGRQLSVLLDGLRAAPGGEHLPEPAAGRLDLDEFFRTRFGI